MLKRAIVERATQLVPLLAEGDRERTGHLLEHLEQTELAIAVIGQVKAGKSTFINALTEHPRLLPSDVNPWTAAIAKLHFGRPGGPTQGASFRFFTSEEWARMADGGGLKGELSQRLGAEGAPEELLEQMREMKARAEKRLGRMFRHLLGRQHRFEGVDPAVLQRYLCSGDEPEGFEDGEEYAGRFADITREADLYFDAGPFGTYCTVLDTPGTNDPFLVRGEITRRHLGRAHSYVLVLTAQQAMSASDVALLRMLHGLHKDRLVVFINRTDKLSDVVGDSARIRAHVGRILQREFPDKEIPVVFGSAWWGEQALIRDPEVLARVVRSEAFAQCVLARRSANEQQLQAWRAEPERFEGAIAGAMLMCSGVPEVRATVSDLLLHGRGGWDVANVVGSLLDLADEATANVQAEIKTLHETAETVRVGSHATSRELESLGGAVERLAASRKRLGVAYDTQTRALRQTMTLAIDELDAGLSECVAEFADSQAAALAEHGVRLMMRRTWKCDTGLLRGELERRFLELYDDTRHRVSVAQDALQRDLTELAQELALREPQPTGLVRPSTIDPRPSMTTLATVVAVDLGTVWSRWLTRQTEVEDKARELHQMILAEFGAVVERLTASASDALQAAVESTIERLSETLRRAVRDVSDRLERQRTLYEQHLRARDPERTRRALTAVDERVEGLRERLTALKRVRQDLKALPVPSSEGQ